MPKSAIGNSSWFRHLWQNDRLRQMTGSSPAKPADPPKHNFSDLSGIDDIDFDQLERDLIPVGSSDVLDDPRALDEEIQRLKVQAAELTRNVMGLAQAQHSDRDHLGRVWQDTNKLIQNDHQLLAHHLGAGASIAAQFHDLYVARPKGDGTVLGGALVGLINRYVTGDIEEGLFQQEIRNLLRS
jgi:hypothetical protein